MCWWRTRFTQPVRRGQMFERKPACKCPIATDVLSPGCRHSRHDADAWQSLSMLAGSATLLVVLLEALGVVLGLSNLSRPRRAPLAF
jgi:hypothetical protein